MLANLETCLVKGLAPSIKANLPKYIVDNGEQARQQLKRMHDDYTAVAECRGLPDGGMEPEGATNVIAKASKVSHGLEIMVDIAEQNSAENV